MSGTELTQSVQRRAELFRRAAWWVAVLAFPLACPIAAISIDSVTWTFGYVAPFWGLLLFIGVEVLLFCVVFALERASRMLTDQTAVRARRRRWGPVWLAAIGVLLYGGIAASAAVNAYGDLRYDLWGKSIPALCKLTADPDARMRSKAYEHLGMRGGAAQVPTLLNGLDDPDWGVVSHAAAAIAWIQPQQIQTVPALVRAYAKPENQGARETIVWVLEEWGRPAEIRLNAILTGGGPDAWAAEKLMSELKLRRERRR
ncbi:MAG: HEAT repeat domain-containing protein [Planctomycetota bacterium]|jgi:hypothetical protein